MIGRAFSNAWEGRLAAFLSELRRSKDTRRTTEPASRLFS